MKAELFMPPVIEQALEAGAVLTISLSGGADSQALAEALTAAQRMYGWPGPIFLIHAHLGRAEWRETLPHIERIRQQTGLELMVVQRAQGDMVARWQERQLQLAGTGTPFWSSSGQRYCTSDMKRDQIDKALRKFPLVISAEGIRAEESDDRAEKLPLQIRRRITAKRFKTLDPETALAQWKAFVQPEMTEEQDTDRLGFTWYPLFHWSKEDVWRQCGTSSEELERCRALYQCGHVEEAFACWPCHPAYVLGSSRVSCALCVLASRSDLLVGAKHNPELLQTLVAMEQESHCSFKRDLWLSDLLAPEHEEEEKA
jgi:3'-phosphoadenosine 5'-phosphosulfate sulfotransferase (PAPS reductase)/FAD synthetase